MGVPGHQTAAGKKSPKRVQKKKKKEKKEEKAGAGGRKCIEASTGKNPSSRGPRGLGDCAAGRWKVRKQRVGEEKKCIVGAVLERSSREIYG